MTIVPRTGVFLLVLLGGVVCARLLAAQVGTPDTGQRAIDSSEEGAIAAATQEFRTSGVARTVVGGDFITFPFGHAQPTLTCSVLRACIVELEPGEILLSRISGDTERWEIATAESGAEGRTMLVVVKPRDCDITTNLVLATDRRLYDLTLDAPACKARSTNPQLPYARHVRFYYPDDVVVRERTAAPSVPVGDPLTLNFAYRIKRDRQFPWTPAEVFEDGARVYIKLPPEARHSVAPVLFVIDADGKQVLLNYNIIGDTYVTDRLFERAVLVTGVAAKARRLEIDRTRTARP